MNYYTRTVAPRGSLPIRKLRHLYKAVDAVRVLAFSHTTFWKAESCRRLHFSQIVYASVSSVWIIVVRVGVFFPPVLTSLSLSE